MLLNDKTLSQDVKYGISDLKNSIANIKKTSYETTKTINEVNKILAGINDKENIVAVLKDSAVTNFAKKNLYHTSWKKKIIGITLIYLAPFVLKFLREKLEEYEEREVLKSLEEIL